MSEKMSREEAIEVVKKIDKFWITDREGEALDMVIKALENHDTFMKYAYSLGKHDALSQEPMREFTEEEAKAYSKALDKMYKPTGFNVFNEPCNDAISRDAVCKMICAEFVNPQDGMQEWRNAVNDVVENILHKAQTE